jgi:hypothetical protein
MGIAGATSSVIARILGSMIGSPATLPTDVLARYPELAQARWRRGGLPPRVGGWCLGARTVSGITLWRTIWLAPGITVSDELLLHELRHVYQFGASRLFPILYLWESMRRGYVRNRFEVDAREYAAARIREAHGSHARG